MRTSVDPVSAMASGHERRERHERHALTATDALMAMTSKTRCWSSLSPKPMPNTERTLA